MQNAEAGKQEKEKEERIVNKTNNARGEFFTTLSSCLSPQHSSPSSSPL